MTQTQDDPLKYGKSFKGVSYFCGKLPGRTKHALYREESTSEVGCHITVLAYFKSEEAAREFWSIFMYGTVNPHHLTHS